MWSVSTNFINFYISYIVVFYFCLSNAALSYFVVIKPSWLISICLNKFPIFYIYFPDSWDAIHETANVFNYFKFKRILSKTWKSLPFYQSLTLDCSCLAGHLAMGVDIFTRLLYEISMVAAFLTVNLLALCLRLSFEGLC